MIHVDFNQGSDEWLTLRLGLVSASRFKELMTEPKSKADKESGVLSATSRSYMMELIAEILTGEEKKVTGPALDWGTNNESRACAFYEAVSGNDVEVKGILLTDDKQVGASPDGFIGDFGGLEIKCPYNSANHIATVIAGEMPKEHVAQVQGNMLVNGRQWWDFVSYDPRIDGKGRIFITRINRDDEYIEKLQIKLTAFLVEMKRILKESFGIEWHGVTLG